MAVYKRGSVWWYRFEAGGIEYRRSTRTRDERTAEAVEQAAREEVEARSSGERPYTFDEAMARWMREHFPSLKPSARRRYLVSTVALKPHFAGQPLTTIRRKAVADFVSHRRAAGVTDATIRRDLAALSGMLTHAVDWGWIEDHPAPRMMRGTKESDARVRWLTMQERARLEAAVAPHLKPLVIVALETGMRLGELLALDWDDVDLKRGEIRIRDSKNRQPRSVPLSSHGVGTLSGTEVKGVDAVFTYAHRTAAGRLEHRRIVSIREGWAGAVRRAKLPGVRFHDLRHTFATWAIKGLHAWQKAPMDSQRLSRWLGHNSLAMTKRYSHLADADLHSEVDRPKAPPDPPEPEPAQDPAHTQRIEELSD